MQLGRHDKRLQFSTTRSSPHHAPTCQHAPELLCPCIDQIVIRFVGHVLAELIFRQLTSMLMGALAEKNDVARKQNWYHKKLLV